MRGVTALMYHDVAERDRREHVGFPGPTAARYKLEPAAFETHLDAVAATGAEVGLVAAGAPPPQVALTFDDGGASALLAAEALERRGWRGHFFVTTGRIGTPGFLSAAGVRELAERGHAVGSHSHNHPTYMGRLDASEIDEEWRRSRAILGDLLGSPPPVASVPGGFLSRTVVEGAAAASYAVLMTSEPVVGLRRAGSLLLVGRFTIRTSTSLEQLRAYVRRERGPRSRVWLEWNAKKLAKHSSPAVYESLRRVTSRR